VYCSQIITQWKKNKLDLGYNIPSQVVTPGSTTLSQH
jgi:hypothetical protein